MLPIYTSSVSKSIGTQENFQSTPEVANWCETSNPEIAFQYYFSAAQGEDGDAFAQYKCGVMLFDGQGVPQNVEMGRIYLAACRT